MKSSSITGPLVGFIFVFVFCIALVTVPSSCGSTNCQDPKNAGSATCNVIGAVVECTGVQSPPTLYETVKAAFEQILEAPGVMNPDGSINLSAAVPALEKLGLQYGMCIIAQVIGDYINPPSAGSGSSPPAGSGSATPATAHVAHAKLSSDDAKKLFGAVRAKIAPKTGFAVKGGTL